MRHLGGMQIDLLEISEHEAERLVVELPLRPVSEAFTLAIASLPPCYVLKMMTPSDGILYVTASDWLGTGIYRVTVTL